LKEFNYVPLEVTRPWLFLRICVVSNNRCKKDIYMSTILIIALIVVFIIIGFKWMSRPLRHHIKNLDELKLFFEGLIAQCTVGSILIVEDKKTKRFIQFAKRAKVILHFGFPDAPWSRKYFKRVEDAFKKNNIQYTINQTGEDVVTKFLDIEFVEIDKGVEIAKIAFHAMDIPSSGHFRAYYEGDLSKETIKESLDLLKGKKNKK